MLVCPKCKQQLLLEHKTFKCNNNHCYDLSKRGYVNLSMSHKKDRGDDKMMVESRTRFLNQGYYQPLLDQIIMILSAYQGVMLDCGCGEGYYTNAIKQGCNDLEIYGIDLSKSAIDHASKAKSNVQYVVASLANLPIKSNSIDVILSIFAPIDEQGFYDVLKQDGIFIKVGPAAKHLMGLKKVLYEEVYENEKSKPLSMFEMVDELELTYEINLNNIQDILDLFAMTPYYYKTSKYASEKLKQLDQLKTMISFEIQIYRKSTLKGI